MAPIRTFSAILGLLGTAALQACTSETGTAGTTDGGTLDGRPEGPATPVTATEEVPWELTQALDQAARLDADGLRATYAPPTTIALMTSP
jgi:hypothetical protein